MKKLCLLFCSFALVLTGQEISISEVAASFLRRNAAAIPDEPVPCEESCLSDDLEDHLTSHLQVGGSYTHVRLSPNKYSTFNGNLAGVQGLYEYRTQNRIYGGASARWRKGKLSSTIGTDLLMDVDGQGRIGYTFGDNKYLFSLFSGFGFRYLRHEPSLEKVRILGETIDYEEFYIPVGFFYSCQYGARFNLGLQGIWMPQVDSQLQTDPSGGIRWILKKRWKNAVGALPLTFSWDCYGKMTFIFRPFFEYWQDGPSTEEVFAPVLGFSGNKYLFAGIDLNICYSF